MRLQINIPEEALSARCGKMPEAASRGVESAAGARVEAYVKKQSLIRLSRPELRTLVEET